MRVGILAACNLLALGSAVLVACVRDDGRFRFSLGFSSKRDVIQPDPDGVPQKVGNER